MKFECCAYAWRRPFRNDHWNCALRLIASNTTLLHSAWFQRNEESYLEGLTRTEDDRMVSTPQGFFFFWIAVPWRHFVLSPLFSRFPGFMWSTHYPSLEFHNPQRLNQATRYVELPSPHCIMYLSHYTLCLSALFRGSIHRNVAIKFCSHTQRGFLACSSLAIALNIRVHITSTTLSPFAWPAVPVVT